MLARRPHPTAWIALGLLLAPAVAHPAAAQTAFIAANANTSLFPWHSGLLIADFPEAKVGLSVLLAVDRPCDTADCQPDRLAFTVFGTAAARKGQRDLFAGLDFTPGYDAGVGLGYVWRGSASYTLAFVRATYSTLQRRVIEIGPTTSSLDEVTTQSFTATVGVNRAWSRTAVAGVAVEGRRELSSPGLTRPTEFCTPGTTAGGIRIPICSDRFLAPLGDLWTGHVRADVSVGVVALGSDRNNPRLGFAASGSVDVVERGPSEVSAAVGPAVILPRFGGLPAITLLVGLRDVFDVHAPDLVVGSGASDLPSYFDDHFLVRLALGVPFAIFTGR